MCTCAVVDTLCNIVYACIHVDESVALFFNCTIVTKFQLMFDFQHKFPFRLLQMSKKLKKLSRNTSTLNCNSTMNWYITLSALCAYTVCTTSIHVHTPAVNVRMFSLGYVHVQHIMYKYSQHHRC